MRRNFAEKYINNANQVNVVSNKLLRMVLIIAGTFFVGLGIIGIFVPLLPTTPFLLLATACYAKSSLRFYLWLLNNRWFGNYIRDYRSGNGVLLKVKVTSILILWVTIILSSFFMIRNIFISIGLVTIAIITTIHILNIRTLKATDN